jgi:glycosyltransferase involved in cell wall biosynthesis
VSMVNSQSSTAPIERYLPLLHSADDRYHWFSSALPETVLQDDFWRFTTHFYSHELFLPTGNAVVLDIGARSGLFALYFASLGSGIRVVAVEENNALFAALNETITHSGLGNIHCFRSLEDATEYLHGICDPDRRYIGLVFVDNHAFNYRVLERLARDFRFGHLCGEFETSAVRAVHLFRLSQYSSQTFFWRIGTRSAPMSGAASPGIEVSIVVPMYNVEKYLEKCLESLVKQTLEHKEIILVDDGSPDSSGRIADAWADRYPEIRVIHQENGGCAAARSRGLAEARGSYVAFVDSDDWVDAPMFERLYEAAVTNNAEVAQCGFREVYVDDGISIPRFEEFRDLGDGLEGCIVVDAQELLVLQPTIWRRIYKTDFLRHHGIDFPRHLPRYDDLPFQFEVFMRTTRMVCIPEIYYNYRLGRVGQDVMANDERLYVHFHIFQDLREKVAQLAHVAIERELIKVEVNTHNWGLKKINWKLKWRYAVWAARDIFGRRLLVGRWTAFRIAWTKSRASAVITFLLDLFLPGDVGKFRGARQSH